MARNNNKVNFATIDESALTQFALFEERKYAVADETVRKSETLAEYDERIATAVADGDLEAVADLTSRRAVVEEDFNKSLKTLRANLKETGTALVSKEFYTTYMLRGESTAASDACDTAIVNLLATWGIHANKNNVGWVRRQIEAKVGTDRYLKGASFLKNGVHSTAKAYKEEFWGHIIGVVIDILQAKGVYKYARREVEQA